MQSSITLELLAIQSGGERKWGVEGGGGEMVGPWELHTPLGGRRSLSYLSQGARTEGIKG